ncbi:Trigger factor [[Leptolyngbya] sp. PCC 7376]|uniref:trigger factor n=1 Tax=[Leptolyngbya] sp. PCC 7376 TaxID=111781 RepID=UPI00029F31E4|nr:trigger factor [[Leptolyngbya] sp. PCC 7376]AFY40523.1 Trigger factor [[Leptolyngbya] sp. PCC 7376]
MKVTQEKLPASQVGLEIEVSADVTQKAYNNAVSKLARTVNLPGFRKGKVPRQILIQRLGSGRIKATVLEDLIDDSLKAAIDQEKIEALGNYKLTSSFDELIANYKPGEPFTFKASVDVPASVTLGTYKGLEFKAEQTDYDPSKLDEFVEQKRSEAATLVPVEDRGAQMGDVAIADYEGRYVNDAGEEEGEIIPGTQAEDFSVEMEEGKFVPGFIEGFIGMKLEETKKFVVTFPEEYGNEEMAGKDVSFTATLKELKERELPELDDEFASDISNEEFETLDAWKASLEEQFKKNAEITTKNSVRQQMLDLLAQNNEVDLPEVSVNEEITAVLSQQMMEFSRMGIDINQIFTKDMVPKLRENARPEAEQRLGNSLILTEIAKVEKIEPDEEKFNERLEQAKSEIEQDFDEDRLKEAITEEIVIEATLDWLQEQSKIEFVPAGTLEAEAEETEETIEVEAEEEEE